jgi:glucoamylase
MYLKKIIRSYVICTIALLVTVTVFAEQRSTFTSENINKITGYLENNIATNTNVFTYNSKNYSCKSIPGAVVASPKGMNEVWARDTALVMGTIVEFYKNAIKLNNEKNIQKYGNYLINYVSFLNKTVPVLPPDHAKFYIDGKKFPWMNQADGPALRIITLADMAQTFIDSPQTIKIAGAEKSVKLNKKFVEDNFFNSKSIKPENNLIKYEADFISANWEKKTIDLWEESSAHHFFSELVQMKASLVAATLAKQLDQEIIAKKYLKTSYDICQDLKLFYHKWKYYGIRHNLSKPLANFYCYTENKSPSQKPFEGKIPDKWYDIWQRGSGLNSSTMLGVIYANMFPDFQKSSITYRELSKYKDYKKLLNMYKNNNIGILPTSNKVIQTVFHFQNAFTAKSVTPYAEGLDVYAINSEKMKKENYGVLVGRYPGDNYNGVDWSKVEVDGNPWYLATSGLANYYYTLAREYIVVGKISIPGVNTETPDVVKFFRQITGNESIKSGVYVKESKVFNEIINGLVNSGNNIMKAVVHYAKPYNMRMSEQINRNTGKECSYRNLSWSYSSFLDAYAAFTRIK